MNNEIKLYEKVYNGGLGNCYLLLKETDEDNNNLYLFFSESNNEHFIICDNVDKENGYFYNTTYASTLKGAIEYLENYKKRG